MFVREDIPFGGVTSSRRNLFKTDVVMLEIVDSASTVLEQGIVALIVK